MIKDFYANKQFVYYNGNGAVTILMTKQTFIDDHAQLFINFIIQYS